MSGYSNTQKEEAFWNQQGGGQHQNYYIDDYTRFNQQQLGKVLLSS